MIWYNIKERKMKRMFIKVFRNEKSRHICTEDISKMFYFKKRPIPRSPKYQKN